VPKYELTPLLERIHRRTTIADSGCWEWDGALSNGGYGVIGRGRAGAGNVVVHRAVWELCHGPVPAGMDVCHTCDNRRCHNAGHLFLGTRTDNMRDAKAKGRTARGERQGRSKLTEDGVLDIRANAKVGAWPGDRTSTVKLYAEKYGVSIRLVMMVVRGERWGWLDQV
jgi:HNH endonuclease